MQIFLGIYIIFYTKKQKRFHYKNIALKLPFILQVAFTLQNCIYSFTWRFNFCIVFGFVFFNFFHFIFTPSFFEGKIKNLIFLLDFLYILDIISITIIFYFSLNLLNNSTYLYNANLHPIFLHYNYL